jgi:hypothetical protein
MSLSGSANVVAGVASMPTMTASGNNLRRKLCPVWNVRGAIQ